MNRITIKCPKCGGIIEADYEFDTFLCSCCGCGYKILHEGQSDAEHPPKIRLMVLEQEDRMVDKKIEESRNLINSKRIQNTPISSGNKKLLLICLIAFVVMIVFVVILNT
ncbi:MAG: hypothetical protein ACI4I2_07280 [Oscillospiraceae bacterium]